MNIAWFIFTTFIIIGVHVYIQDKFALKHIRYSRSFNQKAVFEGEKIEMVDEISNRKLLPVPWLRLESKIDAHLQLQRKTETDNEIDAGDYHRTLFSLLPYQKVKRRQQLTCTKRGYYRFETVSLTSGDLFGVGEANQSVPSRLAIIVYPRLIPIEQIPLPTHSWLGDIIVKRWIMEDPFLVSGVRDYTAGDSLNTINWKATARTNRLQVSKKDFTADHHLMIYINFNQTEDVWVPIVNESSLEKAISYAGSIAQYAIDNGIRTGFASNSYMDENQKEVIRIDPENGKPQLVYILETLAKLKMGTCTYIDYFLKEEIERDTRGMDLLFITSFLAESTEQLLRKIELQGNAVEVLYLHEKPSRREQEKHAL